MGLASLCFVKTKQELKNRRTTKAEQLKERQLKEEQLKVEFNKKNFY